MLDYLKPLRDGLVELSDSQNAEKMKAYMKGRFEYFGIKSPVRKSVLKEFVTVHGKPEYEEIREIVFDLFAQDQREFHYCAIEICGLTRKEWDKESLALFEEMALTKSWWDSVDSVNSICVRPYFLRFPELADSETLRWAKSDNIWLQRLSLIFQLRYKEKTDKVILERNIGLLKDSDEFFVQKAVGWVLRDLGHTDPDWVKEFVDRTSLRPLSRREALKHLR